MNYNGIIESILIIIASFIGAKLVSDVIANWRIKVFLYWTVLAICFLIYLLSIVNSYAAIIIISNPPTDLPGWTHIKCQWKGPDQGIQAGLVPDRSACNTTYFGSNSSATWTVQPDEFDTSAFGYISVIPSSPGEYPITDIFIRDEAVHLVLIPFVLTDLSDPAHSRIWSAIVTATPNVGVTAADIMVGLSAWGLYEHPGVITGLTTAAAIMALIKAQIDAGYYGHKDPSFIFSGDGFTGSFDATESDGVLFGINNLIVSPAASGIPEPDTWYTVLLGFFSLGIFYKCRRIG